MVGVDIEEDLFRPVVKAMAFAIQRAARDVGSELSLVRCDKHLQGDEYAEDPKAVPR